MLKYLLLLAILPIILVSISSQESYSELSNVAITVTTDKSFYPVDSTITISGEVRDFYSETPVTTSINAPNGNLVTISQVSVNDDKTFSIEYTPGNSSLMLAQGVYIVTAQYGSGNIVAVTYFDYIISSNPVTISTESLTITTNKPSYTAGETIQILGEFNNNYNGTSPAIALYSDIDGSLDPILHITTKNNQYATSIDTSQSTILTHSGNYTLIAKYDYQTVQTTFYYDITPTQHDNESFIPDDSYLILSDQQISKWNHQIEKWENAQNRTDSKIDRLYDKLDRAISRNDTDKIERWTEEIGHSMALSSLYDGIIECLEEQIELLS